MLDVAYESNERQLRIINDLLRVAQIDAGKVVLNKEPVNLVQLLQEIIDEQIEKFVLHHQKITLDTPSEIVHVLADPHRMRMVFENLIDNASKYTLDDKNIVVQVVPHTKRVTVHVIDEGIGISHKDISKLFQKFSRLDSHLANSVSGTGLGLYWAKKIITLHDGTLSVESTPEKGSTFTVTIPR